MVLSYFPRLSLVLSSSEDFTIISRIFYLHCWRYRQLTYLTRGYATLTRFILLFQLLLILTITR